MEITINNTRFNITAEELESAGIEFSFWEGRRFKLYGKDVKEHFLRYNDVVKGVLAEDATFTEGEDKQKIYATCNHLKDKGYPHNGSCWTKVMLMFKQMFGNIFRQELLDQLETKLNVKSEALSCDEELSTSEEINSKALTTIYDEKYVDLFPLMFKYAGRTACFPLMLTCKLFHKIITVDKHQNYHLRDLDLMKQIFEECQHTKFDFDSIDPLHRPTIEPTNIIYIESKCLLLLAEFFPKEVNTIAPPNKVYERSITYIKHQQRLATVLAKIDPKSALKVVASMDADCHPVQAFCAVAAIHKNSILCDEKQVLAMGDIAYADPTLLTRQDKTLFNTFSRTTTWLNFENLMELFEASIGSHSLLANKTLELMEKYLVEGRHFQDLAKMVKRIGTDQLIESEFLETIVGLLSKPLELDFKSYFGQDAQFNIARSLALIAKTLVIFDQTKAIHALELAINSVDKLQKDAKVGALIEIAEAFASFDQNRAFEASKLALKAVENEGLYLYNSGIPFYDYRLSLFDSLGRIIRIFATNNREYAIQVLREVAYKIVIMEENVLSQFHVETTSHAELETFLYQFPKEIFMGAIELYASFDHKQALEMANFGVEWAKTRVGKSRQDEEALLKFSLILLKNFPDQALEVANMLSFPQLKCEALLSIVSQESDYT